MFYDPGQEAVFQWLMDGDPAIRWQTMRDLLGAPESEWRKERQKVEMEGWGARFLASRLDGKTWEKGRWTEAVWTLVTLSELGLERKDLMIEEVVSDRLRFLIPNPSVFDFRQLLADLDLCHVGFWLSSGAKFTGDLERVRLLAETIFSQQMPDGGWNCRRRTNPRTVHGSFHTTFNVLDGLKCAFEAGMIEGEPFQSAQDRAMEFMLQHQMFKSDKTGDIIDRRFLDLTYPSRWHYNILRGLDYVRLLPEISDPRLDAAFSHLLSRRDKGGRWPSEKRIPGVVFFDMEKPGRPSRWVTLKALRILKARFEPTQDQS